MSAKARKGRPSSYTQAVADDICVRLAEGEPITRICRDPNMPDLKTVYLWLRSFPEFLQQYARAREDQADTYAADTIAIADQAKPEEAQVARLRIDARKWYAGKIRPKVYGERIQQEVTGADGGPVETSLTIRFVEPDSPLEQ